MNFSGSVLSAHENQVEFVYIFHITPNFASISADSQFLSAVRILSLHCSLQRLQIISKQRKLDYEEIKVKHKNGNCPTESICVEWQRIKEAAIGK